MLGVMAPSTLNAQAEAEAETGWKTWSEKKTKTNKQKHPKNILMGGRRGCRNGSAVKAEMAQQ